MIAVCKTVAIIRDIKYPHLPLTVSRTVWRSRRRGGLAPPCECFAWQRLRVRRLSQVGKRCSQSAGNAAARLSLSARSAGAALCAMRTAQGSRGMSHKRCRTNRPEICPSATKETWNSNSPACRLNQPESDLAKHLKSRNFSSISSLYYNSRQTFINYWLLLLLLEPKCHSSTKQLILSTTNCSEIPPLLRSPFWAQRSSLIESSMSPVRLFGAKSTRDVFGKTLESSSTSSLPADESRSDSSGIVNKRVNQTI